MEKETWRYEASTKTIRSVPGNHWIASMDSWDAAVDHEANAKLIAMAPEMLQFLKNLIPAMEYVDDACAHCIDIQDMIDRVTK